MPTSLGGSKKVSIINDVPFGEHLRSFTEHESLLIGGTYVNHLKGPCPVHRLGHFGMCVTNYQKAHEFYTTFFNFKATDVGPITPC